MIFEIFLSLIGLGILGALVWLGLTVLRTSQGRSLVDATEAERQRRLDEELQMLRRMQAEVTGRIDMLTQNVGQRFDSLQTRVGDGLQNNTKETIESLSKLNERLAVIDSAQKNLTSLTSEVLTLKDVLSNKQTRGAFGQGRMEAIIRDGLPSGAYAFQGSLSNNTRPDCLVSLPDSDIRLVIDAKFPLENFRRFLAEAEDDRRRTARRAFARDSRSPISGAVGRDPVTGAGEITSAQLPGHVRVTL